MQARVDVLLEFWEVCTHAVLHTQRLYPEAVFEERLLYGLPVRQARHPDINNYVRRVLSNTRQLVVTGLARTLVLTVLDRMGSALQQISFDASLPGLGPSTGSRTEADDGVLLSNSDIFELEVELRSSLLKLATTCGALAELPADCSWELNLLVSNEVGEERGSAGSGAGRGDAAHASPTRDETLDAALRSGEWAVDNHALPETISRGRNAEYAASVHPKPDARSQVVAVKSFETPVLSSSIYVYLHCLPEARAPQVLQPTSSADISSTTNHH